MFIPQDTFTLPYMEEPYDIGYKIGVTVEEPKPFNIWWLFFLILITYYIWRN